MYLQNKEEKQCLKEREARNREKVYLFLGLNGKKGEKIVLK